MSMVTQIYDSATLHEELTDSTARLPLAVNLRVSSTRNNYTKKILNLINDNIIKVTLGKEKMTLQQRRAWRISKR
nr:MAG: wsv037-like protein [Hemigrapsus takanoi nimavirus]